MKQKNIDTIFQNQLHGYASPMDTEAFYSKLSKRKKGGAFWQKSWLLLLLFTMGFISVLAAYKFSAPKKENTPALITEAEQVLQKPSSVSAKTDELTNTTAIAPSLAESTEAINDASQADRIELNIELERNSKHAVQEPLYQGANDHLPVENEPVLPLAENTPISSPSFAQELIDVEVGAIEEKLPIRQPHALSIASSVDKQIYMEAPPNIAYNRSRIQWGVDVQGGYSWASRDFTLTDAERSDNLILRSESEEILETVQLAVLGRATLESGLYARLGAGYTRVTERFEASGRSITVDTLNVIQEIIISPTGDTTIVRGDMPVTTTNSFNKRTHNYHHLIDVPLIIGYTIGDGESPLTLQIEAGAIMNLSLRSTGEIWGDNSQIIDVEDAEVFEKNVGISYYGALHLRYALNDQLGIYVGPYYRHLPKSFTKSAYGIEQRYQLLGLNAGIQIGL